MLDTLNSALRTSGGKLEVVVAVTGKPGQSLTLLHADVHGCVFEAIDNKTRFFVMPWTAIGWLSVKK